MNPILYESTETSFTSNGIGVLKDCVSCTVTEALNGKYELEMTYPITGIHFSSLALRNLVKAKPNATSEPQPFRIYEITRPLGGVVTVRARHLSYDLSGIPVSPFTASTAVAAMSGLRNNAVIDCPFTFWTDKTVASTMKVETPCSIRNQLGGKSGSVLDVYGGEYEFDGYNVYLHTHRGENRGVSIRYGKNLTDINQEENCENVYTGVYPYWVKDEEGYLELPEKLLYADGTYSFTKILVLDLTSEFEDKPTEEQLRTRAKRYMSDNGIGIPKVSLTVSFVRLEQTEEYKGTALLERVGLGDTVNVEFPALSVSATAKCNEYKYNALLERFESVSLGDVRSGMAQTMFEQKKQIEAAPSKSFLKSAVDNATAQITGNVGGYVVLHSSTGGKTPDELLLMDKESISEAVNVWRWNKSGLGYSKNGYNGPYETAITADGSIVADFITTGTLAASLIKTGVLSDQAGKNYWNMDTGEFKLQAVEDLTDAIVSVVVEYAVGDSATTAPTSGWSSATPTWTAGKYIWQRTKTVNADNKASYSSPTCIQGATGPAGADGTDGADGLPGADGKDGAQGETGETGIGVADIEPQYYLSSSDTTTTGGSWSTSEPSWKEGYYIWTRSKVAWTDGTASYTTAVLASAINGANETAAGADKKVDALDKSLDQEGVFNRLTNNGTVQGIYLENGDLYVNASYMKSGTLNAENIEVKNLTATGVDLTGAFRATSDDRTADLWAATLSFLEGEEERVLLFSSTRDSSNYSTGALKVCGSSGSYSSNRTTLIEAANAVFGQTDSGEYVGTVSAGTVAATDINLSGKLLPREGQNALYCDWVPVQDMYGNQQWVLAGFRTPQGG